MFDSCLCLYFALSSFRAALDRAAVLLKMSLGGLRMDNQWGTGGGQRPITQLIKEVNWKHTQGWHLFVLNPTYEVILTSDFKLATSLISHPWISQSAPDHFYTCWRFGLRVRFVWIWLTHDRLCPVRWTCYWRSTSCLEMERRLSGVYET